MNNRLTIVYGRDPSEVLAFGEGSWAYVNTPDLAGYLRVRFVEDPHAPAPSPDDDGPAAVPRIVVGELHFQGMDTGVTGTDLRALPLGRIEAAVNHPDVRRQVWDRAKGYHLALDDAEYGKVPVGAPHELAPTVSGPFGKGRRQRPKVKLAVPGSRRYPDAFYEQVAEAYSLLAARREPPAQALAAANAVPITTVNRWVKEARRRGLLAPAPFRGQRGGGAR